MVPYEGKIVNNNQSNLPINISTRGIKEYLNQPFDEYYVKNELIRQIPNILENAKYLKHSKTVLDKPA